MARKSKTEKGGTQQPPTIKAEPQKEHQWLEKLVGDWSFEGTATMEPDQPPQAFKGSESVSSLGGLWVLAKGQGQTPCAEEAQTLTTLGYDPQKKRYIGTFIGSMMSHLWIYSGELDETGKVLSLETEGPDMEGRMAKFKDVIEFLDDDHRVLSSHMLDKDGHWLNFMTAHYHRTA